MPLQVWQVGGRGQSCRHAQHSVFGRGVWRGIFLRTRATPLLRFGLMGERVPCIAARASGLCGPPLRSAVNLSATSMRGRGPPHSCTSQDTRAYMHTCTHAGERRRPLLKKLRRLPDDIGTVQIRLALPLRQDDMHMWIVVSLLVGNTLLMRIRCLRREAGPLG